MFKYIWLFLFSLVSLQTQASVFLSVTAQCQEFLGSGDIYALLLDKGPAQIEDINSEEELRENILGYADSVEPDKLADGAEIRLQFLNVERKSDNYWLLVFNKENEQIIKPQFLHVSGLKPEHLPRSKNFFILINCAKVDDEWNLSISSPSNVEEIVAPNREEEDIVPPNQTILLPSNPANIPIIHSNPDRVPKLKNLSLNYILATIKSNLNEIKERLTRWYNNAEEVSSLYPESLYKKDLNDYKEQIANLKNLKRLFKPGAFSEGQVGEVDDSVTKILNEISSPTHREPEKFYLFSAGKLRELTERTANFRALSGVSGLISIMAYTDNEGNKYINVYDFMMAIIDKFGGDWRLSVGGKIFLNTRWSINPHLYFLFIESGYGINEIKYPIFSGGDLFVIKNVRGTFKN